MVTMQAARRRRPAKRRLGNMVAFVRTVRARHLITVAVAAGLVFSGAPAADAAGGPASPRAVAPSGPVRILVDFCDARVVPGTVPGPGILVVTGVKPYRNLHVVLVPRTYVRQPEYWGIEVTGTAPAAGPVETTPYVASIPLDGITGTRGIEVIGAHRSQTITLP